MTTETIAGMELEVESKHELTCTIDGHNKFWTGVMGKEVLRGRHEPKPFVVVLRWGRIGTVGQGPDIKRFTAHSTADSYLRGRLKDKTGKGYVYGTAPVAIPDKAPTTPKQRAVPFKEGQHEWDIL